MQYYVSLYLTSFAIWYAMSKGHTNDKKLIKQPEAKFLYVHH